MCRREVAPTKLMIGQADSIAHAQDLGAKITLERKESRLTNGTRSHRKPQEAGRHRTGYEQRDQLDSAGSRHRPVHMETSDFRMRSKDAPLMDDVLSNEGAGTVRHPHAQTKPNQRLVLRINKKQLGSDFCSM